jgi:hypothetical protein
MNVPLVGGLVPVELVSDIKPSAGQLGYSVLYRDVDGSLIRRTVLMLRDGNGRPCAALILPSEQVMNGFQK